MKSLDYAELKEAADKLLAELCAASGPCRGILLSALTDIAKRAFKQASRPGLSCVSSRPMLIGHPPVLLSDACTALDKPKETTMLDELLEDHWVIKRIDDLTVKLVTSKGVSLFWVNDVSHHRAEAMPIAEHIMKLHNEWRDNLR